MKHLSIEGVAENVEYALYHDMEEAVTGDLPAPVKRGKSWDDVEREARNEIMGCDEAAAKPHNQIVKMADTIAALIFADEEVKLGNTWFEMIRGELIMTAKQFADRELNQLLYELGFTVTDMSHL